MEPVQYLRALQQWWWVIVASGLIGVVVVAATVSNSVEYTATHDLIYVPSQAGTEDGEVPATIQSLAFLTTRGEIPRRVAAKLDESPAALASSVSATADPDLGTLSITATAGDPDEAEEIANTFAAELEASRDELAAATRQQTVDELQAEIAQVRSQLAVPGQSAEAQEDLNGRLSTLTGQVRELNAEAAPDSGLSTVAAASASQSGGTGTATSLFVGGFVGLLIGVGLALVLTRYDTRIRTKEEAEMAFGLPVIAEIPLLSRRRRQEHAVVSLSEPESSGAEAYRTLRTSLVIGSRVRWSANDVSASHGSGRDQQEQGDAPGRLRSQTVLVVSPGAGEGKSTSVANLAATFAESGKYVLVLSGDLRRPMVDGYLGVARGGPGMSELLAHTDGLSLVDVVRATSIPNVRMIPSGETVSNPGELLSHYGADVVADARNLADVVIIDSPPLLATDDASPLLPLIDDVLVVCRAGVTTAESAKRTSELLGRLGASVAGVALVGASSSSAVRGYYRAYGTTRRPAVGSAASDAQSPVSSARGRRSATASDSSRAAKTADTA